MRIFQMRNIALVAALMWTGAVSALPMLDQENDATGGGAIAFVGGSFPIDRAQTFTVGLAGVMSDIEVQVSRTAATTQDLFWDLRTLNAGAPTDPNAGVNILASGSVAAASFGTVDDAFVSLGGLAVNVAVGDMLAIVLRSDDPELGAYRWRSITRVDSYAGGAQFDRFPTGGNVWVEEVDVFLDTGFRTYVDTGPVVTPTPNPATVALFGLGLTLLGWSRRKAQA